MEKLSGLTVEFKNQKESRILINFLKDKGFTHIDHKDHEDVNLLNIKRVDTPVYLMIIFKTKEILLTDLKHTGNVYFGIKDVLDYEQNKSKIYEILFEGLGMGKVKEIEEVEDVIEEDALEEVNSLMIKIQMPKNSAKHFSARKEIVAFLSEYKVPFDKQYNMYQQKVYTWMMVDYNNKTYWFENDINNTSSNISFHYLNDRIELLTYLEEITGYQTEDEIERSVIDEKVDLAEEKLNEFFLDVVDLGFELKHELREAGEELFIDVKENVKGLTKRTIKNIMQTDPSQVKESLVNKVNQTKENITIFSKVIKRKIKNL